MKGNSNCCDATAVNGICKDCGEHCDVFKFDCELCEDTGVISCDHLDSDGNWERGTDEQKCECTLEN